MPRLEKWLYEAPHSHQPDATPTTPLIGPTALLPFMVIPDVECPEAIASSPEGNLVVSIVRQKVLLFNSDFEKVLELGGEPGLGMGKFLSPNGVAVDSDGNILVAGHYFIQKFTGRGQFLQQAGGTNPKGFMIDAPRGMAIGKGGRIYIAEQKKHRILILNPDLSFCKTFTDADRMLGSGHLNMPQDVAINSQGNVYIADMMNHVHSIQVFDAEGQFLFRFGRMGAGPGCTTSPSAIAIDQRDYVYVGTGSCSVSIFNPKGDFVRTFGEHGSEVGKFNQIRALHIDRHGVLYVGEWTSNRIQMFRTGSGGRSALTSSGPKGQVPETTQVAAPPPPINPLSGPQPGGLNITGGGSGMVVIGSEAVVKLGPNVVFGGHVSIQPGATVLTDQGPLASPVPAAPYPSYQSRVSQTQEGVIFAKSASTPCKRGGINEPVHVIEDVKKPHSIAVGRNGEIVVLNEKGKVTVFNEKYERVMEEKIKQLANCPVVINCDNIIIAVRGQEFYQYDLELNEIAKITSRENPSLKEIRTVYAMAIGEADRLYLAGVKKAHIVNADFTYYKSFANKCQAFAIAISSGGHVYLPVLSDNTIRVTQSFLPTVIPFSSSVGQEGAPYPSSLCYVRDRLP